MFRFFKVWYVFFALYFGKNKSCLPSSPFHSSPVPSGNHGDGLNFSLLLPFSASVTEKLQPTKSFWHQIKTFFRKYCEGAKWFSNKKKYACVEPALGRKFSFSGTWASVFPHKNGEGKKANWFIPARTHKSISHKSQKPPIRHSSPSPSVASPSAFGEINNSRQLISLMFMPRYCRNA